MNLISVKQFRSNNRFVPFTPKLLILQRLMPTPCTPKSLHQPHTLRNTHTHKTPPPTTRTNKGNNNNNNNHNNHNNNNNNSNNKEQTITAAPSFFFVSSLFYKPRLRPRVLFCPPQLCNPSSLFLLDDVLYKPRLRPRWLL